MSFRSRLLPGRQSALQSCQRSDLERPSIYFGLYSDFQAPEFSITLLLRAQQRQAVAHTPASEFLISSTLSQLKSELWRVCDAASSNVRRHLSTTAISPMVRYERA